MIKEIHGDIVVERHFDPANHCEHITLRDPFGKEHKLCVPLVVTVEKRRGKSVKLSHQKSDPDAEIHKLLPLMNQHYQLAREHAIERGHVEKNSQCYPSSDAGSVSTLGGQESTAASPSATKLSES